MKIIEAHAFDVIGVLMAPAVAATEAKKLIQLRNPNGQNDGKVKLVDGALPQNQTKLTPRVTGHVQMPLVVASLGL